MRGERLGQHPQQQSNRANISSWWSCSWSSSTGWCIHPSIFFPISSFSNLRKLRESQLHMHWELRKCFPHACLNGTSLLRSSQVGAHGGKEDEAVSGPHHVASLRCLQPALLLRHRAVHLRRLLVGRRQQQLPHQELGSGRSAMVRNRSRKRPTQREVHQWPNRRRHCWYLSMDPSSICSIRGLLVEQSHRLCSLVAGDKLGLPRPPAFLDPSLDEDTILNSGVNYASGGGGILNETSSLFVRPSPPDSVTSSLARRMHADGDLASFGVLLQVQRFSLYKQIELFQGTQELIRRKIGRVAADDFFAQSRYVVAMGSNDFINNYLLPVYSDSWSYNGDTFIDYLMSTLEGQLKVS